MLSLLLMVAPVVGQAAGTTAGRPAPLGLASVAPAYGRYPSKITLSTWSSTRSCSSSERTVHARTGTPSQRCRVTGQ